MYADKVYRSGGNQHVVTTIKLGCLRLAGHVARYIDDSKKVLKAHPRTRTRNWGRPKLRWRNGLAEDATKISA